MLTMADKGGRGGLDPPFLDDIICEQPLIRPGVAVDNRPSQFFCFCLQLILLFLIMFIRLELVSKTFIPFQDLTFHPVSLLKTNH